MAFCLPPVRAANATKTAAKTAVVRAKPKQTAASKPIRLKIDVPCRAWVQAGVQPSAVLLCVHGLGLNSKSHEQFGRQMQGSRARVGNQYAADGIRVNTIWPGIVDTPRHADGDLEAFKKLAPLNRIAKASEIVDAVMFLTSATFITGENLRVDGGAHAGNW